jgi:molybdopterin-guanine dinucleotide biosynthesis protein A
MIARPDFVLVGATARNLGKTEFACGLIRRQSALGPVTAVKVTTIRDEAGPCPRGGEGCGVCASVEGAFVLTDERDAPADKDTGRMVRAGAARVLWLRAREDRLEEALAALLAELPGTGSVVCESNAVREVLEPGLFLVLRPRGEHVPKPSAARMLPLADRTVEFRGDGWDLDPDRVWFDRGTWFTALDASAVILAGGGSRRMGQDKSLLTVGRGPLIQRIADQLAPLFPEVLVSANDPDKYRFLGLPVVPDEVPGQGPLMGILSSLKAARRDPMLAVACDIPVLDPVFLRDLVRRARKADVVMPLSPDGRPEPVLAVYGRAFAATAAAALAEGKRRIVDGLPGLAVDHPPMPPGWYHNLNTRADLDAFLRSS